MQSIRFTVEGNLPLHSQMCALVSSGILFLEDRKLPRLWNGADSCSRVCQVTHPLSRRSESFPRVLSDNIYSFSIHRGKRSHSFENVFIIHGIIYWKRQIAWQTDGQTRRSTGRWEGCLELAGNKPSVGMALKLHPTPQAGLKGTYLEFSAIQDLL